MPLASCLLPFASCLLPLASCLLPFYSLLPTPFLIMTNQSTIYQVGGSLPQDATTYAKRKADDEIFQALMAGEFCYVLNSRQMGKSSLRVQTMKRLQEAGVACGCIDFTMIGKENIPLEMWY
ncbi:hypothetical protein [Moorena producens]|nr:hypothetical protein [Moorena producens]